MTEFSLIIVTYNSQETIVPCLESVLSAEGLVASAEVVVVDNCSSDDTVSAIKRQFPAVQLHQNNANVGFGAAVNQGARNAQGELLLFINPDTVLQENFLFLLHEFFKNNSLATIAGCNLVDENGMHRPSCWKTPDLKTVACEIFLPYAIALKFITQNPSAAQQVDMVSGACLAVRRDAFERLHGFDERFFMYYEDADFCLRARREGYGVWYYPSLSVFHHAGKSTTDLTLFYQRVFESKMLFLRKHRSAAYYGAAYMMVIAGLLIRVPAYVIAGTVTLNKKLLRLAKV